MPFTHIKLCRIVVSRLPPKQGCLTVGDRFAVHDKREALECGDIAHSLARAVRSCGFLSPLICVIPLMNLVHLNPGSEFGGPPP